MSAVLNRKILEGPAYKPVSYAQRRSRGCAAAPLDLGWPPRGELSSVFSPLSSPNSSTSSSSSLGCAAVNKQGVRSPRMSLKADVESFASDFRTKMTDVNTRVQECATALDSLDGDYTVALNRLVLEQVALACINREGNAPSHQLSAQLETRWESNALMINRLRDHARVLLGQEANNHPSTRTKDVNAKELKPQCAKEDSRSKEVPPCSQSGEMVHQPVYANPKLRPLSDAAELARHSNCDSGEPSFVEPIASADVAPKPKAQREQTHLERKLVACASDARGTSSCSTLEKNDSASTFATETSAED